MIGIGKSADTEEMIVVYHSLHGEKQLWVRSLDDFTSTVTIDGKQMDRFRRIDTPITT